LNKLGIFPGEDYNPGMRLTSKPQYFPDLGRLSIVSATILLGYALARFANLPLQEISLQLPGLYLTAEINTSTLVALLVAGLTAAGQSWLLSDHPTLQHHRPFEHWLLPALTAWVIGVPLFQLPLGTVWWVGFILGGTILMLVLIAEYVVIDTEDMRQPLAAGGLIIVSFTIFLILAVSLRFASLRLFLLLPALTTAAFLVSLRTLHLRLQGKWLFIPAGIVALVIGQFVAAFHYWPLSPVAYGLALLGPAYSLTILMAGLQEGKPLRQSVVEPVIVLVVLWTVAGIIL
jgi:hypothetical protein